MIEYILVKSALGPPPDWYLIFLAICRGLFIIGVLVFLIEVIFSGLHFIDHGHAVDKSMDHDIAADHDISVDHDVSADHDHDFHFDKKDLGESSAPLLLLIAAFSLSMGFLGVFISAELLDSYIFHLIVTLLLPIEVVWLTSHLWRKVASDYLHPLPEVKFGTSGRALTDIDHRGGLILVQVSGDTDSSIKEVKKPAKTAGEFIERNSTVYILGKENSFFIVSQQLDTKAKEWTEN